MSRIIELEEGNIFIDGIDIASIPLKDLRSRITVIPQDPTIFKESLRFNLDPENKVSDQELVAIIEAAGLTNLLNHGGLNQQLT